MVSMGGREGCGIQSDCQNSLFGVCERRIAFLECQVSDSQPCEAYITSCAILTKLGLVGTQ